MELVKGINELIQQADKEVEVVFAKNLIQIQQSEKITIVDIRDIRELWKEGKIKGSIHAPRGMLEFWVDPKSPYHRKVFSTGNKFILYCKSGWRSALATKTLLEMGFSPVAHLAGGFDEWKKENGEVEKVELK